VVVAAQPSASTTSLIATTSKTSTTSTTSTTTSTTTTTTLPTVPTDVTSSGTVSASSTFSSDFGIGLAVDGSAATSWFSSGGGSATYTWRIAQPELISEITIVGNASHSDRSFRSGFGFGSVIVDLFLSGKLVGAAEASLPRTPDPTVMVAFGVDADEVRLSFTGGEDPSYGGFASWRSWPFADGASDRLLPPSASRRSGYQAGRRRKSMSTSPRNSMLSLVMGSTHSWTWAAPAVSHSRS
jgi:hypothetical protein